MSNQFTSTLLARLSLRSSLADCDQTTDHQEKTMPDKKRDQKQGQEKQDKQDKDKQDKSSK